MNTTNKRVFMDEMSLTHHALATIAFERYQLYGFLANVFKQEPDEKLLLAIRNDRFKQQMTEIDIVLDENFYSQPIDVLKAQLGIEFTRLFMGPGKHISPHESVQSAQGSGILWGQETSAVKRYIEAAGFDFEQTFTGLPDHISVELAFLSKLCRFESDYWIQQQSVEALNVRDWQAYFLSQHADQWMVSFSQKVKAESRVSFYQAFSVLLAEFIKDEIAQAKQFIHQKQKIA